MMMKRVPVHSHTLPRVPPLHTPLHTPLHHHHHHHLLLLLLLLHHLLVILMMVVILDITIGDEYYTDSITEGYLHTHRELTKHDTAIINVHTHTQHHLADYCHYGVC